MFNQWWGFNPPPINKNKTMDNALKITTSFATCVVDYIKPQITSKISDVLLNVALAAYNRWEEDEHGGVDYIFNINHKEDLIQCVKGGLTAWDIEGICKSNTTYFRFGENYEFPSYISRCAIIMDIVSRLKEIVGAAILYSEVKEYNEFLSVFFYDHIFHKDESLDTLVRGEY